MLLVYRDERIDLVNVVCSNLHHFRFRSPFVWAREFYQEFYNPFYPAANDLASSATFDPDLRAISECPKHAILLAFTMRVYLYGRITSLHRIQDSDVCTFWRDRRFLTCTR